MLAIQSCLELIRHQNISGCDCFSFTKLLLNVDLMHWDATFTGFCFLVFVLFVFKGAGTDLFSVFPLQVS